MGLPNVVDQARAIIACGCTRKPQLEKHVQSLSFLGGFLWSTTPSDCHRHGSFCCHLLQNSKYPWPPRWFIESLFYYLKNTSPFPNFLKKLSMYLFSKYSMAKHVST